MGLLLLSFSVLRYSKIDDTKIGDRCIAIPAHEQGESSDVRSTGSFSELAVSLSDSVRRSLMAATIIRCKYLN